MRLPFSIDSLGIATSMLCILHCLALPLFLCALPGLASSGYFHHDDKTHFLLAGWVILFGCISIVRAQKSQKKSNLLLMIPGFTAVLIATFVTVLGLPESVEIPLITIGNLFVMGAHHLNRRSNCCKVA